MAASCSALEAPDPATSGPRAHPPEDHSWAARAEALQRERPAQLAALAAVFASLAMLAGWIAVLIPAGTNIRFSPNFWLLAVPAAALDGRRNEVRPLGCQQPLAGPHRPACLSVLALLVAPTMRDRSMLGGSAYLDTHWRC